MLGKLIKNEFKATYKMFALLFSSLLVLTLLTRFCVYIPFENIVFKIMTVLLAIVYVVVMVLMTFVSVILVIRRFYQNMLRDQGYLSHTLPVKMWQQIFAKVITYLVWILASILAMLFSLFIFFVGKPQFTRVMKSFIEGFNEVMSYHNAPVILILLVVLMVLQIIVNLLNFMAALSLGQIFNKHKKLGAVIFYFLLNYVMGFLVSAVMMLMPDFTAKINNINNANQAAEVATPLIIYFLLMILMQIVTGAIYFVITNYMLTKKLNLE